MKIYSKPFIIKSLFKAIFQTMESFLNDLKFKVPIVVDVIFNRKIVLRTTLYTLPAYILKRFKQFIRVRLVLCTIKEFNFALKISVYRNTGDLSLQK